MRLLPDGDDPRKGFGGSEAAPSGSRKEADFTAGQAMKTIVFWLLVISMILRVTAYSTVTVHFVPLMVWKGLSHEGAAFLLGAFAFFNLTAHFFLGWIADKVNKPWLLCICHFVCVVAVLALVGSAAQWQLWLFTAVFTLLDASFPSFGQRWEIFSGAAISLRSEE